MQDEFLCLQETLHKTIVFITHDLDEALRLGDCIGILKDEEMVPAVALETVLEAVLPPMVGSPWPVAVVD